MQLNHMFSEIIKQTLMITSFVMVMMLIIEFINVYTKGRFSNSFQKKPFLQIIIATLLGAIPGCLGTYAIVSLYTHNVIGFGALMATMIATTGDEAFLMLSMFPFPAIILTLVLIFLAIITGSLIFLFEKRNRNTARSTISLPLHDEPKNECLSIQKKSILLNITHISFQRAILLISLIIFIIGLSLGEFGNFHGQIEIPGMQGDHVHEGESFWMKVTFLILSAIAFIISLLATNHFLEHHLWKHIVKVHFLRIFLWTFGTLTFISFLTQIIDIDNWIATNQYIIFIIAVLIGIIPASGPHIIFITLFFQGTIPFSILFVNSVMQDGHGALPLFAESKKSFLIVKLIKMIIAITIGMILMISGY